jgi:hypothetical protein
MANNPPGSYQFWLGIKLELSSSFCFTNLPQEHLIDTQKATLKLTQRKKSGVDIIKQFFLRR